MAYRSEKLNQLVTLFMYVGCCGIFVKQTIILNTDYVLDFLTSLLYLYRMMSMFLLINLSGCEGNIENVKCFIVVSSCCT